MGGSNACGFHPGGGSSIPHTSLWQRERCIPGLGGLIIRTGKGIASQQVALLPACLCSAPRLAAQ